MKKSLLLIISALTLSFTAHATVVECNPGANNLEWYLTQGDTLVLADGIYEEAYSIDFTKPGVCVKAAEGAKPVIKLTGEWTALEVTATTTFDGITFDAGNVAQYIIATLDSTTFETDLTIKNCEFKNWKNWAISHYYQKNVSVNSIVIDNCLFHDAKNSAVYFSEKAPEGKNACQDLKITNSTFYNIGDASAYTTIYCVGGNAVDAQKVTVDYCTFYNCQAKSTDHAAVRVTCAATISNTIIVAPESQGTYRAIHATDGSNAQAINCLTYNYEKDNGGIRGGATTTECQLNVDPKFVDAANGNFALAEGSPALGAGTDGSNLGDPCWNAPAEEEKPVEIVGVVKRALQIGESTVVLTHEADGTPHIYNIIDEEIAEVSQEGVIARDPENPGDHLAISDIVATEDGKLVACNYTRCNYNDGQVETGYKRGTTYVYKWEDLTAAPSVWFTSQYASNSNKSDQGYTIALNGSSTNCQILMSGVHRYGNGVRFTIFDVVDNEVSESFFGYQLGSGLGEKELAIFDEAYDGTNFQLSLSPRKEKKDYIMDAEKMAPVEFETAGANEEPVVLGELDEALVGVKFNGVTYLTIGEQAIMVAPYADAEGQLVGVKVLDITAGLDAATVLKVADLDAPVAATAAATAVAVTEDELIITLVGDATLYTLTVKLTQEPGPGTALENIAVEGKAVKAIINGQLIIVKDGVKFNALGQVIK